MQSPNAAASPGRWHNPFASSSFADLPEPSSDQLSDQQAHQGKSGSDHVNATDASTALPSKKGRVVLRRETAHRGGKVVTIVGDFQGAVSDDAIEALARNLRKACGTGGTVREREIEIQGEKVTQVRTLLQKMGFQVAGVV